MYNPYQAYLVEILSQIIFWCEISKEHPVVILKFVELTDKKMPNALTNKVMLFSERFARIQSEALVVSKAVEREYDEENRERYQQRIMPILYDFLSLNPLWIRTIQRVSEFGKDDEVFQTLLEHITQEQMYAQNVIGGKRNE